MYTQTRLKVGEWVKIVGHKRLHGAIGFITSTYYTLQQYDVTLCRDPRGKFIYEEGFYFDADELILAPLELKEADIRELINVALDTEDKEWFEELMQRLPLKKVKK